MNNTKSDIYVYKLAVDNGGAPCIHKNILSLAICKRIIRKTASTGSLIFGFGGKNYDEKLIYIAQITEKLNGMEYYQETKFEDRPDCIYIAEDGKAKLKSLPKPFFHDNGEQLNADVGTEFKNAHVLLSTDFRYFGKNGTNKFKGEFEHIKNLVENLKQGHRRNYSPELREQLINLKDKIWGDYPNKMKLGDNSEIDHSKKCNTETKFVIIC